MSKRQDIAQIYRGQDGLFYYRVRAGNNEIIANGEGHENKADVVGLLETHFPYVSIVDLDAFNEEES